MNLDALIAGLSRPEAYPERPAGVTVVQTHISVVFLAGPHAYKVKKPVTFSFLDFGTLEKRRHYCEEEVRLNRRLAPGVYLGVVPITSTQGGLQAEGPGEAVEWAVKMQRLPPGVTLHERLQAGEVNAGLAAVLALRLADFHRGHPAPADRRHFARADVLATSLRELFEESEPQVGVTVSRGVRDRLRALLDAELARHARHIDDRAARGLPRDAHGDLHLDHVCVFPGRPPPEDLVVIDCIEFSERLRYLDPVADAAFPAMDFAAHGRRDLARCFVESYVRAARDEDGRPLWPLYTAYRAAVRAAVMSLKLSGRELADNDRRATRQAGRGYWLVALAEVEQPARRPALVLVGGLPGTGKSTLAQRLARAAGLEWVRTDEVRKSLAGVPASERLPGGYYSPEWTERTYAACRERAEEVLFRGGRVLVDATFRDENRRRRFLDLAAAWGVPPLWLVCHASPAIVERRLAARRDDASDADWRVYREAAGTWQPPGQVAQRAWREIVTDGTPEQALRQALAALRTEGLVD